MTNGRSHGFEVVELELDEVPGVAVRGEVDLAAVPALEVALDDAARQGAGVFVLDLSELEFLDSTGMGQILRIRAWLAREDRPLAVVCPPGPVRRAIEQAGIADLLFLYSSHAEATAALVNRRVRNG